MSVRVRSIVPSGVSSVLDGELALREGASPTGAVRAVLRVDGDGIRVISLSRATGAWLLVARRGAQVPDWAAAQSLRSVLLQESVRVRQGEAVRRVFRDPLEGTVWTRDEGDAAFVWLSTAEGVGRPTWPDPDRFGLRWNGPGRSDVTLSTSALLFVPDRTEAQDVVVELLGEHAREGDLSAPHAPVVPVVSIAAAPWMSATSSLDALCEVLPYAGRGAFAVEVSDTGVRMRAGRFEDTRWCVPSWWSGGREMEALPLDAWVRSLRDDQRFVSLLVRARDASPWAMTWTPSSDGRTALLWPLPERGHARTLDHSVGTRLATLVEAFPAWNDRDAVGSDALPMDLGALDPFSWLAFCRSTGAASTGKTPLAELRSLANNPLLEVNPSHRATLALSYAVASDNAPLVGYVAQSALAATLLRSRDERDDLVALRAALHENRWPGPSKLDGAMVAWLVGDGIAVPTAEALKALSAERMYRAMPLFAHLVCCIAPSALVGTTRRVELLDGAVEGAVDAAWHEAWVTSTEPFPPDAQTLDRVRELVNTHLFVRIVAHARAVAGAARDAFDARLAALRAWVAGRVLASKRDALDESFAAAFR